MFPAVLILNGFPSTVVVFFIIPNSLFGGKVLPSWPPATCFYCLPSFTSRGSSLDMDLFSAENCITVLRGKHMKADPFF